ncbi:hypothetical protein ACO0LF_30700 [Undibacterium sp. Di27W]
MQVCPKCGSDNIKSFSIVHDMYSSDDLSSLAYKCAPPEAPELGLLIWVFAVLSLIVAHKVATLSMFSGYVVPAVITFTLCMVGLVLLWYKTLRASANIGYQEKLKNWKKSWLCMQCNNEFERNLDQ